MRCIPSRRVLVVLFWVCGFACGVSTGAAAVVSWDNGGGNQSWGNATNWNPNALPTAADTVVFNDTGAINILQDVTSVLDTSRTLAGLRFENTNNLYHTVNLAGNALTVAGTLQVNTNLLANTYSTLDNGILNLGTVASPGNLYVGRLVTPTHGNNNNALDLSGVSGNSHLNSFIVGQKLLGGEGQAAATLVGWGQGTLTIGTAANPGEFRAAHVETGGSSVSNVDLSDLSSLTADLNVFEIAVVNNGTALANVTLAQTNTIRADGMTIGDSASSGADLSATLNLGLANDFQTSQLLIGGRRANVTVNIPTGGSLNVGSAASPTALTVGRTDVATNTTTHTAVNLSGATWNGHLSQFIVAEKSLGGAGAANATISGAAGGDLTIGTAAAPAVFQVAKVTNGGSATGIVNLGGMNSLTADLTTMELGVSQGGRALALVTLPQNNTIRGQSIMIGHSTNDGNWDNNVTLTLGQNNTVEVQELTVGGRHTGGTLNVPVGGTLNLGTASQRTSLVVGRLDISTNGTTAASVNLSGAVWNAHLSGLVVAEKTLGGSGSANGTISGAAGGNLVIGTAAAPAVFHAARTVNGGGATAVVDLSGLDTVTAHLTQMRLGEAIGGSALGLVTLGHTNTINADSIVIGSSTTNNDVGNVSRLRLGVVNNIQTPVLTVGGPQSSGMVDFAAAGSLTLGSSAAPTALNVGLHNLNSGGSTTGAFDMTGGSLVGHFSQVVVGSRTNGSSGSASGVLTTGASGLFNAQSIAIGMGTGNGTFDFNGGTLSADLISKGTGTAAFNWSAGTLRVDQFGQPTLPFNLNNTGLGVLAPGETIGRTDVYGNFTQGSAAAFHVDVGGLTQGVLFDTVKVNGTATLAGTLSVSLANGYVPVAGHAFEIVHANSISGQFNSTSLPSLSGGLNWAVDYQPNSVVLRVQGDPENAVVTAINLDSKQVLNFNHTGTPSLLADGADGLLTPIGSVYDAAGDLFVTDFLQSRVVRVAPDGTASVFANIADGVVTPVGMTLDHAGNLVLANYLAGNILRIDPAGNGTVVADSGDGLSQPFDVAVAPDGTLVVVDIDAQQVQRVDLAGNLSVLADSSDGLFAPISVAVDPSSNVFVADALTSVVYKITSAGVVSVFANLADGIVGPTGLNFDDQGHLWVANYLGNSLVKLDSAGNATLFANGVDGLDGPFDVAIGSLAGGSLAALRSANVPEPGSALLLALGGLALRIFRFRRHATKAACCRSKRIDSD